MRKAWFFLGCLALLGCGSSGPQDTMAARRREVLGALATNVIVPTYQRFAVAADALEMVSATYANDRSDANRMAAQDAWRSAMDAWQEAEVLQVGPEGMIGTVAGGRDLRDGIYAWPIVRPCSIDQAILTAPITDPDMFATQFIEVRSLLAMEYLLFAPS